MANFNYKARDAQGRLAQGLIDAEDEIKAALSIEKLGLSPIDIQEKWTVSTFPESNIGKVETVHFSWKKRISHQELLVFTRQLSTLISTGAPLITSLENVSSQTQNLKFKQVIKNITASLESGLSFSESLAQYSDIFGNLYVSLIKVGEAGGLLDKVLSRLAELSTQEIDLRVVPVRLWPDEVRKAVPLHVLRRAQGDLFKKELIVAILERNFNYSIEDLL